MRKIIYGLSVIAIIALIVFRVSVISSENKREVYNPTRVELQEGATVETFVVQEKTDVLKEPIFIKNNIGFVSGKRVHKFYIGQKVASGSVTYVGNKIDLDTGMYIIKTRNVSDGNQFAETKRTGFFVPIDAVVDNSIMVLENGIARKHDVKIIDQDAEQIVISNGIKSGDKIIVSSIEDGVKVK